MPPKLTMSTRHAKATEAKKLLDQNPVLPQPSEEPITSKNLSSMPPKPPFDAAVVTPTKKRNANDAEVSEVQSPKTKKASKVLKDLSSHNLETNEGLLAAFRDVWGNSVTAPTSRQELITKIFDKHSATTIKTHFKTNYSHIPCPKTKAKVIQELVQYVCNTFYALQGPVDSKTTPTNE